MSLIKQIVESLKPIDPVKEAIDSVNRVHKAVDETIKEIREMEEEEDWATYIDDEQVEMLADYMKEMIDSSKKRGQKTTPEEAAGLALEDVAGFEAAPPKVMKETVTRLVQIYNKKFGF